MSYPLPVPKEIENVLTTSSDHELMALGTIACSHPEVPPQVAEAIAAAVCFELALRQNESITRKASRAIRHWWRDNGEQATKVAASIALGVGLGIWIDQ